MTRPANPVLSELGSFPLAAFQDLKLEMAARGKLQYDFSVGDPTEPTPGPIRQAVLDAIDEGNVATQPEGLPELRQAIADWVRRRFACQVDPDRHVVPTSGSKEAIFHFPFGRLRPGAGKNAVVWGTPGYPAYDRGQRFAHGVSDPEPLTAELGWRLEIDRLDRQRLDRAMIAWVNYPHNPTGATADLDYFRRMLSTAREHGTVLGSDECYVDIYPEQTAPPPSLLQAAGDDLSGVIVAFSLSKRSGMTGYRSGAFVGDPALIEHQRQIRYETGIVSPPFIQRAAAVAWRDDGHVAERRRIFDAKRDVLLDFLATVGLRTSGNAATFYVWFQPSDQDDVGYAKALLDRGIVVMPGSAFGDAGAGWIRLALVPTLEDCRRAADDWSAAIASGALPS